MTANPLSQRRYAATAVIADIGWITDDEKHAVTTAINGSVHHTTDLQELHLHWRFIADSFDPAVEQARRALRAAAEATGAFCPRTSQLDIREITT